MMLCYVTAIMISIITGWDAQVRENYTFPDPNATNDTNDRLHIYIYICIYVSLSLYIFIYREREMYM